jgi:hypothetical protein
MEISFMHVAEVESARARVTKPGVKSTRPPKKITGMQEFN